MCGIFGYVGQQASLEKVMTGLSKLEYRGYDSAGIAFFDENGALRNLKTTGRVQRLGEMVAQAAGNGVAIAHTRWATHGDVSERNAHPHTAGRVTLVHNGIIENYRELMAALHYTPVSDTDTEIAAALIDSLYADDPVAAMQTAQEKLQGSYAFAVLFSNQPGKMFAMRRESPLALMQTDSGCYLSSDPSAFPQCGEYLVPEEHTVVEVDKNGIHLFGNAQTAQLSQTDRSEGRQGFDHYMLKEILEQPLTLRRTVGRYLTEGCVDFSSDGVSDSIFEGIERMAVVACGTAMHSGLVASHYFRRLVGVETTAYIASEFCDAGVLTDEKCLYVFVSQSGETLDTLSALRRVKENGGRTLSVVNRRGTIIERESDCVLHTSCGPEIAVASTKAFTAQVAVLYLIAIRMAKLRGKLDAAGEKREISGLEGAAVSVRETLSLRPQIAGIAEKIKGAKDIFFLGRAADYAIACEGSLKLKEISYLHAESIPAGELKHGTISLIEPGVPSVAFLTQEGARSRILLSVREVISRGGGVTLFAAKGLAGLDDLDGVEICRLPAQAGPDAAFSAAVCLQLLAYETANRLGMPIDMPRNLAKSVTVA